MVGKPRHIFTIIAAFLYAAVTFSAYAKDEYYVSGIVRDSLTMEPLPYASVTVTGDATGALTNEKGIFELTVPAKASRLQVSCLGYEKKTVEMRKRKVNLYDIRLSPSTTELREVVVKRQKYSKKDNPAVDFVGRLRDAGPLTDPRRNPYYNYDKHEVITLAINDFGEKDETSALFRKFPFLWDHVDTSEVSGKAVLCFSVKEKAAKTHFRRDPRSEKTVVEGYRSEGVDEMADQQSMQTFLNDVMREIDLYDGDINILQNRFVSPLSRIAPDFYRFYLTDTVDVGSERCIVLSFYPRNPASFGFIGQVYVPVGDEKMPIRKVTMRIPKGINLNFIENLYISQEFDHAPDGSRLKTHDDMVIEIKVIPGTPGFYARRNVAYANHSFDAPADSAVFSSLASEIMIPGASSRPDEFWIEHRNLAVTRSERSVGALMQKLRSVPLYYWGEKALRIIINGYVSTGNPSKFDFGPVNTTVSNNDVEGWRFRVGGMTTANLSRRWFARGYAAWATRDHRWKYKAELEYSFIDKEYHSREFPVHSLRLTSMYDVDHPGQHYLFTNSDNFVLSLKRMPDSLATYRRLNSLEYTLELRNNFSVHATVQNVRQHSTAAMPFVDGYGEHFGHYDQTSLAVELRYAPGEKFYQTKTYRVPINLDAPVFTLSHTIGPRKLFGSKFTLNRTELSVQKRFWLSAFGYTDILVSGGHIWSACAYPDLLIPNANLSYTIQPESFALMNPMEFVNDSYAAWHLTYWANGALLNYIPLIKKLKLREVVAFRGIIGHLSDKNKPELHPELFRFPDGVPATAMSHGPYMEISAGIENIFKCLRLDYVWRLSYLHPAYKIDRHGLRVAFHLTF